ncbi:MAG: hypothetical protein QM785_14030 [Pyrinomonadaceae bacterium]
MKSLLLKLALILVGMPAAVVAQSRDQNFPTPITSSELNGAIKARDVGDSRNTSYYYAFEGTQGDIFINIVTKNFAGDIDVFTQDGLKTLTKVVVFADAGLNETGRLIYLRKPEKLILRIQGRTPNDDSASFKIKFGGSFVALAGQKEQAAPTIEAEQSKTAVNSVGTRIELPKPAPVKEAPVRIEKEAEVKKTETSARSTPVKEKEKEAVVPAKPKPEVVIGSTIKEPVKPKANAPEKPAETSKSAPKPAPKPSGEPKSVDPLANLRLVIQMKDGSVITRPMNEVMRFSMDKGVLTVVAKSGAITRYSVLDVAKVTFE